jgi:hypothetical protein
MDRRAFMGNLGTYGALLAGARAQGTSRAPKLKIREIRCVRMRGVNNRFVRIYTDQGLTGTGETLDPRLAAPPASVVMNCLRFDSSIGPHSLRPTPYQKTACHGHPAHAGDTAFGVRRDAPRPEPTLVVADHKGLGLAGR